MSAPSSRQRPKLVFVAPGRGIPFIEKDREILGHDYDVVFLSRAEMSRRDLLAAVRAALRSGEVALLYIWFVEPYDTPQMLWEAHRKGVPSAVVVGGYETVWYPEHGYGALSNWRNRLRMQLSFRLAGAVFPTSRVLHDEVLELAPYVESKLQMIELGIDSSFFDLPAAPKERLAVTVGRITRYQWQVKGLDIFAQASKALPDCRFMILGPCEEEPLRERLLGMGGPNLEVPGQRMTSAELRTVYQRASVYAQLSKRESFGVALAEAMSCGCTPVVSAAGALPEVAGGTGHVVPYGDVQAAARAIDSGLEDDGLAARSRVVEQYAPRNREQSLPEALRRRLGVSFEEIAA
ncbi:MAG: glycosyltransferase family 4 protein [Acidobacteriota bacterium]